MLKKELETRTNRFALSIVLLVSKLPRGKASDVIGYQLLKSGTSFAGYREVNRAQSHEDFIHEVAFRPPQSELYVHYHPRRNRGRRIRNPRSEIPNPSPCF